METKTFVIDSVNMTSWVEYFLNLNIPPKDIVDRISKAGWKFRLESRPDSIYIIKSPKQFVYLLNNPEAAKPAMFP